MGKRKRRALIVGIVALFLFGPGVFDLICLSFRQHQLDKKLAKLKAEEERLSAIEERMRSDPVYVEGLIRSTFKLAKPGEFVVPLDNNRSSGNSR